MVWFQEQIDCHEREIRADENHATWELRGTMYDLYPHRPQQCEERRYYVKTAEVTDNSISPLGEEVREAHDPLPMLQLHLRVSWCDL